MTAKEFLEKQRIYPELPDPDECNKVEEWMIDFAKYHVEQALKTAVENINTEHTFLYSSERNVYDEVEESILNSYPKENIK